VSIEQLFFLLLFVLVPLARTLAERRRQQRAAQIERAYEEATPADVRGSPSLATPAWPAPEFPQAPRVPAPVVYVPAPAQVFVPARAAHEPAPRAPERPRTLPDPVRSLRAARTQSRMTIPRDRASLRKAMLLVEILGPPRALDPRR
jgi:hypothetical protein